MGFTAPAASIDMSDAIYDQIDKLEFGILEYLLTT
jgi:hypothetical protein